MHVGDIAYADYWLKEVVLGYINGTIAAGPELYEQINEEFYDEMNDITSSLPYHVAAGNHDSNCDNSGYKNYTEAICPPALTGFIGYNQHWNMPSSVSGGFKNMWYSYDVGMVHYVVFDTETDLGEGLVGPEDVGGSSHATDGPLATPSSAQMDFLKKDLAAVDRSKTPWVVAAGHRPWYMAAKASSLCTVCQTAFEQLFNDAGVDLVLSGHQHNMQRSGPLGPKAAIDANGLNNPKAPLYITTGAAGHFDGLDAAVSPYPAYSHFVNDTLYGFSTVAFHNRTHRRGHDGAVGGLGCADGHVLLDLCDGLAWVEVLGAGPGAVHDGVAAVEGEGVFELLPALLAKVVARVGHPAVGLHEDGGAEVLVLVPPVAGARGGAAGAEDALVEAVEATTLLGRLEVLALGGGVVGLEERLDGAVLLVELREVRHEILDNVHVRQRVDLGVAALSMRQRQASVLTPSMFMAHEPQMPSRHERRKAGLLGGGVGVPPVDLELLEVLGLAGAADVVAGGGGETCGGGGGEGGRTRRAGDGGSERSAQTAADVE
ncbi:hypothetical protein L1887_62016 [Cichorium endivia]|nr:hypothetical protein L1887_62016 [Cichorium endivia]